MASVEINPSAPPREPELHFLVAQEMFEEPLWKSLFRQLDDFFFPKKLPPLKLESKPEPVKDIWGFYSNWKMGALGAVGFYSLLAVVLVVSAIIARRVVAAVVAPKPTVTLVDPNDIPALKPGRTVSGGGGGGGDRDVLKASAGRLPKFSLQQITPPAVILRNEHPKLAVDPTIVIPPEVKLMASNAMPNLGDPLSHMVIPSNGTGSGAGIGAGSNGGVGVGDGAGYGRGSGGGTGGGLYHRGEGASDPAIISQVDPEFSEEARKAKFQGLCVLSIVVEPDGTPSNIRVSSSLGMGLDEKAIEAVKKWRFRPSMKDGHPVRYGPVEVDVDFHLY
ncbi:MAG TPA: energy transducer TonB [Candidatus Sulfotelmatobacter sp.]